jgi:hypothetical protein
MLQIRRGTTIAKKKLKKKFTENYFWYFFFEIFLENAERSGATSEFVKHGFATECQSTQYSAYTAIRSNRSRNLSRRFNVSIHH